MANLKNSILIGERHEQLVVIADAGHDILNLRLVRVRCDCGREKIIRAMGFRDTQSCGCLRHVNRTHGRSRVNDPTYKSWSAMISRCGNPKASDYARYGARGIKICERWRNSFENFLVDMGERPEGKTLDRYPNNNGNYEPSNCRWATPREQQNNRRSNNLLTYQGETRTMAEWIRCLNLNKRTVGSRLRRGWSVDRALTAPARPAGSRTWRREAL